MGVARSSRPLFIQSVCRFGLTDQGALSFFCHVLCWLSNPCLSTWIFVIVIVISQSQKGPKMQVLGLPAL
jgi:hypothetical protein